MTPQAALTDLLGRVGASQGATVLINDEELNLWPGAAVAAMKSQRLLAKARPASSAICPGCERDCVMPLHTPPTMGTPASFIVCDKRSDTNRVAVPIERLTQWQCTAAAVCGFIAVSVGMRRSDQRTDGADLWNIGIVMGDKRSQMLCLQAHGVLALVVGSNAVPLAELIDYHDGGFSLDDDIIRRLVDAATTADNRYTPSNTKREARKLDTQAMYESWRKARRDLNKKRRDMSDVWYSKQIAKMDIAQGRSADTIKKNMKS